MMNLWLRFLCMMAVIFFRPRLSPFDSAIRSQRVLPSDLDINMHMTNSRYASFADLARVDYMIRTGMMKAAFARGWRPMLLATKIRFRRELKLFRVFRVETRLRWWDETQAIFEMRFFTKAKDGSEILAAFSLERGGFYARAEKRFVSVAEMVAALGLAPVDPPAPSSEILAFVNTNDEMRKAV